MSVGEAEGAAPSDPKLGLACAGGGLEGALYEIGALCALEEAIEGLHFHELDVYVGVSAGGLVVASLANGITAQILSRAAIGRAEDPQLNLRSDVVFAPTPAAYVGQVGQLPRAVKDAIRPYLRNPREVSVLGTLLNLSMLLPLGLFRSDKLEAQLADVFSAEGRTNDFRALRPFLRIVAANVDTAEITTFGDAATAHVPISKAVQASVALPLLYAPVEVDGQYYIDGAARRTLHASAALDQGTDLLFCINPIVPIRNKPPASAQEADWPSLVDHGLLSVLTQTFRMLVYSRMQVGFRSYTHRYPDADVILFEPTPEDFQLIFSNLFSFSNRRAVAEQAYAVTRRQLREQADVIVPKLERNGLRLRRGVLDDTSRTLYAHLEEKPESAAEAFERMGDVLERLEGVLDEMRAEFEAASKGED